MDEDELIQRVQRTWRAHQVLDEAKRIIAEELERIRNEEGSD